MKKKIILMCIAGGLALTAATGGTLADFNTSTKNKGVTNVSVKSLGIQMTGNGTSSQQMGVEKLEDIAGVPGGKVELNYNVTNNVPGGYELYARVTINKKWKEDKLDPSKIRLYAGKGEEKKELIAGAQVNNWIVWYADEEQVIMYYTRPLAAGEASSNLADSLEFAADMNNEYTGAKVELEFRADAVQTIAAEDSIPSEWGVYPVIAGDGTILSIAE